MNPEQARQQGARLRTARKGRIGDKGDMARAMAAHLTDRPDHDTIISQIKRHESGRSCHITERYRLAWSNTLDIPEHVLFPDLVRPPAPVAADTIAGTVEVVPPPSERDDDMERRALVQLLAALGAGTAIPLDALESLRSGLDNQIGCTTDVDDWERTAWEYGHTLITVPAPLIVSGLAVEVIEMRRALARAGSPAVIGALQRVGAQLSAAMAMSLHNLGDVQSSWRWWRTARHAADKSGDLDLAVWMRAREAHNGRYGGRHPATVADLSDDAVRLADGRPSAGLAAALATRAMLATSAGDTRTARASQRQLSAVFERLPATVTSDHETQWGFSELSFRQASGGIFARLGDVKAARKALDQARALCPPDRYGALAQNTLRVALCDINDGDVTHALDSAIAAVTALPEGGRTRVAMAEARDVLAVLPDAQARALPAAKELRALTTS